MAERCYGSPTIAGIDHGDKGQEWLLEHLAIESISQTLRPSISSASMALTVFALFKESLTGW